MKTLHLLMVSWIERPSCFTVRDTGSDKVLAPFFHGLMGLNGESRSELKPTGDKLGKFDSPPLRRERSCRKRRLPYVNRRMKSGPEQSTGSELCADTCQNAHFGQRDGELRAMSEQRVGAD
jgi:hypothetical protein